MPIDSLDAPSAAPPAAQLADRFSRLRQASRREPMPDRACRDRRLAALDRLLGENAAAIAEAIRVDFGHRSSAETRLLELFPAREAIAHARRHLARWMAPRRRPVSLWFLPARAEVRVQPLGAVGIVAPWNYPIYLAAGPLVAALAAGNRAMVKMSEFTPATAQLFARLVAAHFADDELAVVEGDAEVGAAFCALPFDHLLFTGATSVGRHVMRAAAANLTPLTLELGGKSPAILGPGADVERAARRIVVGKCMNAGQTCIAPDYVMLPRGSEEAFIAAARRAMAACYPDLASTPDYTSIINARHYARLQAYVHEALARGARVVELAPGVAADPASRRMPPLAILGATDDLAVMNDEIFGPLLPLVPYADLDAAIARVNALSRPLALYLFENDAKVIEHVLASCVVGGVTINDTIFHIAQDELPFGGVGASGFGAYHGSAGFRCFSKTTGIFRQSRLNGAGLFGPPYGRRLERLLQLIGR